MHVCFVTGANGYLGERVVRALVKNGVRVFALIRTPTEAQLAGTFKNVHVVKGDLASLKTKSILDLTKGFCFIHCAAMLGTSHNLSELEEVNVGGTQIALDFAARHGAGSFCHISTAYCIGKGPQKENETLTVQESTPTQAAFNNGYESSKAKAELLVLNDNRMPAWILRPSILIHDLALDPNYPSLGVFGWFDALLRLDLMAQIAKVSKLSLPGFSQAPFDCVSVDGVAENISRLAFGVLSGIIPRKLIEKQIFLVTNGKPVLGSELFSFASQNLSQLTLFLNHAKTHQVTNALEKIYVSHCSFFTQYASQFIRFEGCEKLRSVLGIRFVPVAVDPAILWESLRLLSERAQTSNSKRKIISI